MSYLSTQILKTVETLSIDDQQQVLDFIDSLREKHQKQDMPKSESSPQSFFEVAQVSIGVGEGPGDISTNPKYMEGYGQ